MSGFTYVRPINLLVRDGAKEPLDLPLPSFQIQRLEGTKLSNQVLGAWNGVIVCMFLFYVPY